jgi:hypothetical protein
MHLLRIKVYSIEKQPKIKYMKDQEKAINRVFLAEEVEIFIMLVRKKAQDLKRHH